MSFMGLVTFLFGYFFFDKYLGLRKKALLRMPFNDRKQTLLMAFVLQFVLFETLGLYGVLISVFTQNTWKALPYVVCAYLGFFMSWPSEKKIHPFFEETQTS